MRNPVNGVGYEDKEEEGFEEAVCAETDGQKAPVLERMESDAQAIICPSPLTGRRVL